MKNFGDKKVKVEVLVPTQEEAPVAKKEWNFVGQRLIIEMDVKHTIVDLKTKIKELLGGMPPNKQKLKLNNFGFVKDNPSLAFYNIKDGTVLELGVKARGRQGKR